MTNILSQPAPPSGGSGKAPLAISLSGGGHRATLFGLGCLLAVVDLGLNRRVTQIASVSGGSILNAFVAHRCRFEEMTRETFEPVAHELASLVVNRGVLTKGLIYGFFSICFAFVIIAIAVPIYWHVPPLPVLSIFVSLFFIVTLLLF